MGCVLGGNAGPDPRLFSLSASWLSGGSSFGATCMLHLTGPRTQSLPPYRMNPKNQFTLGVVSMFHQSVGMLTSRHSYCFDRNGFGATHRVFIWRWTVFGYHVDQSRCDLCNQPLPSLRSSHQQSLVSLLHVSCRQEEFLSSLSLQNLGFEHSLYQYCWSLANETRGLCPCN